MRMVLALGLLLAVTGGACAARTAGTPVPRPFPGAPLPPVAEPTGNPAGPPAATTPATTPATAPLPSAIVASALALRGTPYRNGGTDLTGFDCSGLVQYVFARHGIVLPREVRDQHREGREVDRDAIQPGDLLFFETVSRGASHVAVAIGGDEFVHAPSSTGVVRVERLSSSYWKPRFIGARRVSARSDAASGSDDDDSVR